MRKYVLFAVLVFVSGSNEMFGSARDLHPLASYPQRAAAAVLSFTHCPGVWGDYLLPTQRVFIRPSLVSKTNTCIYIEFFEHLARSLKIRMSTRFISNSKMSKM